MQRVASCYDLQRFIKQPTRFKAEPSCIVLIHTNNKSYLKHGETFVTGVSVSRKLILTTTKLILLNVIQKQNPIKAITISMLTCLARFQSSIQKHAQF